MRCRLAAQTFPSLSLVVIGKPIGQLIAQLCSTDWSTDLVN
jgi:hypothetical protein